jgi:hypothetical protein
VEIAAPSIGAGGLFTPPAWLAYKRLDAIQPSAQLTRLFAQRRQFFSKRFCDRSSRAPRAGAHPLVEFLRDRQHGLPCRVLPPHRQTGFPLPPLHGANPFAEIMTNLLPRRKDIWHLEPSGALPSARSPADSMRQIRRFSEEASQQNRFIRQIENDRQADYYGYNWREESHFKLKRLYVQEFELKFDQRQFLARLFTMI